MISQSVRNSKRNVAGISGSSNIFREPDWLNASGMDAEEAKPYFKDHPAIYLAYNGFNKAVKRAYELLHRRVEEITFWVEKADSDFVSFQVNVFPSKYPEVLVKFNWEDGYLVQKGNVEVTSKLLTEDGPNNGNLYEVTLTFSLKEGTRHVYFYPSGFDFNGETLQGGSILHGAYRKG